MRKLMGINFIFEVEDTFFVEMINSYAARSMNDFVLFQQDAHVIDLIILTFEKRQITSLRIMYFADRFPLSCLLSGILQKPITTNFENHLGEARAINSKGAFTAP